MKKDALWYSSVLVFFFIAFLAFAYWFFRSSYFPFARDWVQTNIVLYTAVLYTYKVFGILVPPLPSGIVTLASIPFLGWPGAYAVDLAGSITGGVIAYRLGKRYGERLLSKVFTSQIVEKMKNTKIRPGKEIESVFMMRIMLGSTISEAVYYGAGFLRVHLGKFLIGALLSHAAVGIPSFMLAHTIFSGTSMWLTVVLSIAACLFVIRSRGRYFE